MLTPLPFSAILSGRPMGKKPQKTTSPPVRSKKARRRTWIAVGILVLIILIGYLLSRTPDVESVYGKNDPVIGNPQAKVTIVEYSDFQCPACRLAHGIVKKVLQEYGDSVRLVYNDFPLVKLHANAFLAAEAAQCANSQGKFGEYHDLLFEEQDIWSPQSDPLPQFLDYAKITGVNLEQFSRCLENHETRKSVKEDMKEGEKLRIRSTPTFFINNARLVGPRSLESFKREIDAQLGGGEGGG